MTNGRQFQLQKLMLLCENGGIFHFRMDALWRAFGIDGSARFGRKRECRLGQFTSDELEKVVDVPKEVELYDRPPTVTLFRPLFTRVRTLEILEYKFVSG
jgi:hypothetical protein